MYELVFAPHALGAQAPAVQALRDERARRGDELVAAWAPEYGALNRLVSLWRLAGDSLEAGTGRELSDHWLEASPVRCRLASQRPVRHELLASPLLELRRYAPQPGQAAAFLRAYLDALPERERYSPCIGVWTAREQHRDVVVHLWAYRSFDERNAARAAAAKNAVWAAYRARLPSLLGPMQAALMTPVPA